MNTKQVFPPITSRTAPATAPKAAGAPTRAVAVKPSAEPSPLAT